MDFITWWFDSHPIWSTIFSPGSSVLWGIYTDNAVRVLWAASWYAVLLFGKLSLKKS
jgi:hypothetical protein